MNKEVFVNGCSRGFALVPLLVLFVPSRPVIAQRATPRSGLVGTWRLAEHWNRDSAGTLRHQYGPQPIGYFVHDATGHFSVQIMRTPVVQAIPPIADTTAMREFIGGYYAAFGTFMVDTSKAESVYHVEGSTLPSIIGTDGHLPYRLSGDSLIIGDSKSWRRVWVRVR
jgi:lipocalin-like protein